MYPQYSQVPDVCLRENARHGTDTSAKDAFYTLLDPVSRSGCNTLVRSTVYASVLRYGGYAAPQMSYVPQATMGGYPGAATHSPYLDAATITQQEKDATEALNGQASMQQKMLDHQYAAQGDVLLDSTVQ